MVPSDKQLHQRNMVTAVKAVVVRTGLPNLDISPDDVGSHSLRTGGAMTLNLNGISNTSIKKSGHWQSMAFLQYFHSRIGQLSAGLS